MADISLDEHRESSTLAVQRGIDSIQIYKLFNDTECLATRYERAVREGKELLGAVEWCRYVFNSGILELLKRNESQSVIKIEVAELAGRVKTIQDEAQYQWTCALNKPRIDLSEVEAIHRKVDAIAEWICRHDVNFKPPIELIRERRVIEIDFTQIA